MTTEWNDDDYKRAEIVKKEEEEVEPQDKQNRVLAMICITAFALCTCLIQTSFKKAEEHGASVTEFLIINAATCLLLMPFVHFFLKTNPWTDLPSGNMTMIFARGAAGMLTTFAIL